MRSILLLLGTFLLVACGGDDDGTSDVDGGRTEDGGRPRDEDAGPGEDDLDVPLTITLGSVAGAEEIRFAALCQTWIAEGEIAYSVVASPVCTGSELYMYFILEADEYTVLSGTRMNATTGERGDVLRIESTSDGEIVATEMGDAIEDLPEGLNISLSTEVHSLLRFRFDADVLTISALRRR
jgi:hypothetical protein